MRKYRKKLGEVFAYFMIVAFSQSATTFVSQNYAAGKLDRVRRIMWICLISLLARQR